MTEQNQSSIWNFFKRVGKLTEETARDEPGLTGAVVTTVGGTGAYQIIKSVSNLFSLLGGGQSSQHQTTIFLLILYRYINTHKTTSNFLQNSIFLSKKQCHAQRYVKARHYIPLFIF